MLLLTEQLVRLKPVTFPGQCLMKEESKYRKDSGGAGVCMEVTWWPQLPEGQPSEPIPLSRFLFRQQVQRLAVCRLS